MSTDDKYEKRRRARSWAKQSMKASEMRQNCGHTGKMYVHRKAAKGQGNYRELAVSIQHRQKTGNWVDWRDGHLRTVAEKC